MAIINTEELQKLEKEVKKKIKEIIEIEKMHDSKGLYELAHPILIAGSLETKNRWCRRWEWEYDTSIFVAEVLNKNKVVLKRYKRDYREELRG